MYCQIRRNEGWIGAEGYKNPSSVQQTLSLFSCRIFRKHWKHFSNEFACIVLSNGNYMNMDCGISSLKICSLHSNFEGILMQCLFSSSVNGRRTTVRSGNLSGSLTQLLSLEMENYDIVLMQRNFFASQHMKPLEGIFCH